MLRSDELATFLGAFERYQKGGSVNANRAHMLALYDGGPRRIDRVLRGKIFVANWSAVPVGHIYEPAKVRPLVDCLSNDGLLQRFMLVMPPLTMTDDPDNDDVRTDWEALDQYAQIVETLFKMRPPETQVPPEPTTGPFAVISRDFTESEKNIMEEAVKDKLKDPFSAQFKWRMP